MTHTDLASTFRQEARELLEQLEQILLDLAERPADQELIDGAFCALHTIKGSGAMFGFEAVASFVHEFETAFDRVRKGKSAPNPALVSVALTAKDHIAKLIEHADASGGAEILAVLSRIVAGQPAHSPLSEAPAEAGGTGMRNWRIRFSLPRDALVSGANPLLLLDEIRALGPCNVIAITDDIPPLDHLEAEICYLGWDIELSTERPVEAIDDVFMFLRDDMVIDIAPLAAPIVGDRPVDGDDAPAKFNKSKRETEAEVQKPQPGSGENSIDSAAPAMPRQELSPRQADGGEGTADKPLAAKPIASLRVPAERLDELMDRVGELVIAQARLNQIASASSDSNLKTIAEELERLSSGLRDTTMGIRMVPIGSIFGRFRRLIHDLARDLGKEIEFVTFGEETELDKTVIERLADPLVHMIRNAVDHGIEAPADRLRAGKPAKGTVRLAAIHAGGEVALAIADDGAGLDAARIRAKAEEAGLIAPDAKLADSDLFQFLFHPGFSTAREVTALSGRGVGMDVVKRTIDSLRGTIDITTTPGKGTTTTLRLPLTMAIIDGMLVRVGNGRYTIPLSAVEECVELTIADARHSGRSFLNIRDSLVPFLSLRELFKTTAPADPYPKVVIVSSGEFRVGLVVDQIIGNNQTVIKSLSKLHAGLQCFSGATILGDGAVALILDIPHLVNFGQAFEERLRGRAA
jgi:two-component system chemotaxis sensor kinase CheA